MEKRTYLAVILIVVVVVIVPITGGSPLATESIADDITKDNRILEKMSNEDVSAEESDKATNLDSVKDKDGSMNNIMDFLPSNSEKASVRYNNGSLETEIQGHVLDMSEPLQVEDVFDLSEEQEDIINPSQEQQNTTIIKNPE